MPKPVPGNQTSIAAQYARAKALQDAADAKRVNRMLADGGLNAQGKPKSPVERLNERKAGEFQREWGWVVGFFVWLL